MRILEQQKVLEAGHVLTVRELIAQLVGEGEASKIEYRYHHPDAPVFILAEDGDGPDIHPVHTVDAYVETELEPADGWRVRVKNGGCVGDFDEDEETIVVIGTESMPVRCQGCGNELQAHEIDACDSCEDLVAEQIYDARKAWRVV